MWRNEHGLRVALRNLAREKSSNVNHIVSRGVACRPEVSPGKWKAGWKEDGHFDHPSSSPRKSE